jgi:hypothetical protein
MAFTVATVSSAERPGQPHASIAASKLTIATHVLLFTLHSSLFK